MSLATKKTAFLDALDDLQASIEDLSAKYAAAKSALVTLREHEEPADHFPAAGPLDNNLNLPVLAQSCMGANALHDLVGRTVPTSEQVAGIRAKASAALGAIS